MNIEKKIVTDRRRRMAEKQFSKYFILYCKLTNPFKQCNIDHIIMFYIFNIHTELSHTLYHSQEIILWTDYRQKFNWKPFLEWMTFTIDFLVGASIILIRLYSHFSMHGTISAKCQRKCLLESSNAFYSSSQAIFWLKSRWWFGCRQWNAFPWLT